MSPPVKLTVARSRMPSRLKSAATAPRGCVWPGRGSVRSGWKVPSPRPSKIETSWDTELAVARSRYPSPSKSAARMKRGPVALLVLKGAVPQSQQDRNVVGAEVGGGQVQVAIAVEVTRDEVEGGRARGPLP